MCLVIDSFARVLLWLIECSTRVFCDDQDDHIALGVSSVRAAKAITILTEIAEVVAASLIQAAIGGQAGSILLIVLVFLLESVSVFDISE